MLFFSHSYVYYFCTYFWFRTLSVYLHFLLHSYLLIYFIFLICIPYLFAHVPSHTSPSRFLAPSSSPFPNSYNFYAICLCLFRALCIPLISVSVFLDFFFTKYTPSSLFTQPIFIIFLHISTSQSRLSYNLCIYSFPIVCG